LDKYKYAGDALVAVALALGPIGNQFYSWFIQFLLFLSKMVYMMINMLKIILSKWAKSPKK